MYVVVTTKDWLQFNIYIYIYIVVVVVAFSNFPEKDVCSLSRNGCCILAFYIAICAADFGSIDSSMIVYVRLWVHWSHKRQFFV